MLKIKNVSPFVRECEEESVHNFEYIREWREWRPWVWVVVGTAMISFCAWLYIVVKVGSYL